MLKQTKWMREPSFFGRPIVYHMAVIGLLYRETGVTVAEELEVAASTLRYPTRQRKHTVIS